MEVSLWLAKVLGIYLILMGLFWMVRRDFMLKVVQDYYQSPALVLFTGAFGLLVGLLIVLGHPIFELNWRGLVTLLGCLSLLKGFLRLFALDFDHHLADKCLKEGVYQITGIVMLVMGAILTYRGFYP